MNVSCVPRTVAFFLTLVASGQSAWLGGAEPLAEVIPSTWAETLVVDACLLYTSDAADDM
jgi:hypothetical protein